MINLKEFNIKELFPEARRLLHRLWAMKSVRKFVNIVVLLLVIHSVYVIFCISKYNRLPSSKKDIRIREVIVSKFPKDYNITIKLADLVGLGDKFYIAYGNKDFVDEAYYFGENSIADLEKNKGKTNRPIIKFFYLSEPGLLSSLISLTPFSNIESKIAELSIKQYYQFTPIIDLNRIGEAAKLEEIIKHFDQLYCYPRTFSLRNILIDDIDGDSKDEVVAEWLSYDGTSRGTTWSSIFEFIDGNLRVGSGYPEIFNINFSRYLWAILRYSGDLNPKWRDIDELANVLDKMDITEKEREILSVSTGNELYEVLNSISERSAFEPEIFVNTSTKEYYNFYRRSTDDYCKFLRIGENYLHTESYYIADSSAHWGNHYWRIMSFLYRDGRWISDRNVNGPNFEGTWLDDNRRFTLNEIFGTYPDQGLLGLAFSFIRSDWTATSKYEISDPLGVEMRVVSPVDKKIRMIYDSE